MCKDTKLRLLLQERLEACGANASPCEDEGHFLSLLKQGNFDVALTVFGRHEADLKFVLGLCEAHPALPILVLAIECSIEDAVKIMQAGAEDLILEPWDEDTIKGALERASLNFPLRKRRIGARRRKKDREIICKSPSMLKLLEIARNVAPSKASVLIQGESGTGKELLARYIHQESDRSGGPFVAINCASLPDTLLESELFGHLKGSFTGAIKDRKGKFSLADGGTLFLDEIGELPIDLQPKLLRALQEQAFEPVGGTTERVDVRVVAATNRDLEAAMLNGEFREDLYYRLAVVPIELPPLRERRDDIPLLLDFFLQKHHADVGVCFSPAVLAHLQSYAWPGNVRELENVVEQMLILRQDDCLRIDDLPARISRKSTMSHAVLNLPDEGYSLEDLEQEAVTQALQRCSWNKSKAAEFLRIPRHTLLYRLEKYDIRQN
ncbi:MAG: sigma-54 dependent transcriptional regulator [Geopsychrobacter sp.]|nr:sigma-54 dependent transcriptional regulator [Geopsychrobacter sp.]